MKEHFEEKKTLKIGPQAHAGFVILKLLCLGISLSILHLI